MSITSRFMARLFKLPPAETHQIVVEKNLQVPMPDGVVLLADHYFPREMGKRPTILYRAPYSDRVKAGFLGELLAERGFQVVMQSGRGTFGSGGTLNPFRQEHDDGLATVAWLKQQPWFDGNLGMLGTSYRGYAQWAIARDAGSVLKAISTQVISADLRSSVYYEDAFALEVWLGWVGIIHSQEGSTLRLFATSRKLKQAVWHLPLGEIDQAYFGKQYPFWQDWLAHEQPDDPWWIPGNHLDTIPEITVPNHLVGGWYDFFLPHLIRDYLALANAGRKPYLTIGPWTHFANEVAATGTREGLVWLRAHLLGDRRGLREMPVRIFVMGANEWRDYSVFPPDGSHHQAWYLQTDGQLAPTLPAESTPEHYRYDPSDPTPAVSGTGRSIGTGRPSVDNRKLEARPDVLTYTSDVLDRDVEVIGLVSAELVVKSSLEYTDFFVRLCDVYPNGKSMNVCDGIQRLFPGEPSAQPDGTIKVTIHLAPTAYRFARGHRIRVQVSSGAFPRWNRNLGTGEPLATGTAMRVAEQQVYHDPAHPSAVILPVSG